MNFPLIFWILSWLFAVIFFAIYLKSILSWETKPHIYTAALYAIMTGIIFYSQIVNGAWIGSIYLGTNCLFWSIIFLLSFKYGVKDIVLTDKISLLLALFSIPIWYFTWNPFLAVVLLMIVDLFSTLPTIRKTYVDPYSEHSYVYLIEFIWIAFSIAALTTIDFINAWYLIYIMIFDVLMFLIVYYRRKVVLKSKMQTW